LRPLRGRAGASSLATGLSVAFQWFPLPSSGGFLLPPNLDIDQLQISTLSVAFTACCGFKFV
jgi:hypothetical protein